MKLLKITLQTAKYVLLILILLFALATFMGRNYWQTVFLILAGISMVYWPLIAKKKAEKRLSLVLRIASFIIFIGLSFTVFSSGPKTTIYTSDTNRQKLIDIYNDKQESWPEGTYDIYIDTDYGVVHVLACGSPQNPPLVLLHAASMGAHSWAENIDALIDKYHIYAIDNPGEGNKSALRQATKFPKTGKEIADLYASVFDSLGIKQAYVFGASNGGYIAQVLAYHHPEKVKSLALFGPMGLTKLSNKSIFMMSIGSMYPFRFVRNAVTRWAIGKDEYCNQKYGDWFDVIVKGTIPSIGRPVPMTTAQKEQMDLPVLLFLGTKDPIVGDAELAKKQALFYPHIQIEILRSGHLIAVEQRDYVNKKIREFLD